MNGRIGCPMCGRHCARSAKFATEKHSRASDRIERGHKMYEVNGLCGNLFLRKRFESHWEGLLYSIKQSQINNLYRAQKHVSGGYMTLTQYTQNCLMNFQNTLCILNLFAIMAMAWVSVL